MAIRVRTIEFYGTTDATFTEEDCEASLFRPHYARIEGGDDDPKAVLEKELRSRREIEEAILEPQRRARKRAGQDISRDLNLVYTALIPICQERWKVTEGESLDVRYRIRISRPL
ncbi:MAG: hypothetical protein HY220_00230 [Candidatus Sungbacteria bacterium]|uniref:Uncharacterized protein n=1 Tax=Candidatus Sungiibacteriota bacterium TaxID=2750080 RepID=A0A9D6LMQ2_9BACT|nr:hypothetical protein [Candidatus Sungbacteria bacterium]